MSFLLTTTGSKGIYARRASTLNRTEIVNALEEIKTLLDAPGVANVSVLQQNALFLAIQDASEHLSSSLLDRCSMGTGDPAALLTAVARYARRAAYRATPFGLFAGVGPVLKNLEQTSHEASFSESLEVTCTEGYKSHPLVSSEGSGPKWLISNLAVTESSGNAVIRELSLTTGSERAQRQSFKFPPILKSTWEECRFGQWADELTRTLNQRFGVSTEDCTRIIDVMVRKRLLFALPEPQTLPNLIGHPTRVVDQSHSALVRLTTLPVGPAPQGIHRKMDGIVARLFQLKQKSNFADAKQRFSNRFLDRFGAGLRVPYLQAVDDIQGVGFINLNEAVPEEVHQSDTTAETLEGLVLRAQALGSTEVELSEHDVDMLIDPSRRNLGINTDVIYSIDTRQGQVELSPMPTSAFSGQALVRHWEALPNSWFESVRMQTDSWGREVEPIEVWSIPRTPKILDIMHAPQVTDRYLTLGFADSKRNSLTLDDIELLHDGNAIWLFARGSEVPLVVRNLSVVNIPAHLSRDAQTIITLGRETERDWVPFNWGPESSNRFLPAVMYRGVRISKAIWRIPGKLFDKKLSNEDWQREFEFWRDAVDLPQWVEFGIGDNLLPFNTLDVQEFEEIRRCIRSDSPVAFDGSHAIENDRAVEYVQHVHRPAPTGIPRDWDFQSAPRYSQPTVRRDWISFELVGPSNVAWLPETTLQLVNAAREQNVNDWHFVVYNDPDPHTRLRFHVGNVDAHSIETLREAAIQEIGSSIRVVREVPYLPEYQRYGGERYFSFISSVFTDSSEAALSVLDEPLDSAARLEAACLSAIDLLTRLLGPDNWEHLLGPALSHLRSPAKMKKERKEILSKLPRQLSAKAPPILAGLGSVGHASGIAMSVLHMHANRMFAGDRSGEEQMHAVIRSYILRQRYLSA